MVVALTPAGVPATRELLSDDEECAQRLEFIGDAFLNAIIADMLRHAYPQWREGWLTEARSLLVSNAALYEHGVDLGIDEMVKKWLSARKGYSYSPSLIANTLEAIFGAVYQDGGFDALYDVLHELFDSKIKNLLAPRRLQPSL